MFIATKRLLFNKNKNLKYNITENETSHITIIRIKVCLKSVIAIEYSENKLTNFFNLTI